jgi:hypothetical protein
VRRRTLIFPDAPQFFQTHRKTRTPHPSSPFKLFFSASIRKTPRLRALYLVCMGNLHGNRINHAVTAHNHRIKFEEVSISKILKSWTAFVGPLISIDLTCKCMNMAILAVFGQPANMSTASYIQTSKRTLQNARKIISSSKA